MIYFTVISLFLITYSFIAWRNFNYAFYFLVFYIPFQLALNPPITGIDVATSRLMILILLLVILGKYLFIKHDLNGLVKWIKGDKVGQLLILLLCWSGISIFWSDNFMWGLRKWLVFASIFPLYWVTLYAIKDKKVLDKILIALAGSAFLMSLVSLIQFSGQFILGKNEILHFWGRTFFPYFLGNTFGDVVFANQSWFVAYGNDVIMRAVGFFPDPHTLSFYLGLVFFPILITLTQLVRFNLTSWVRGKGVVVLVAILVILSALLLTFSRSAYLGLFAGLSLLLLLLLRTYFRRIKRLSLIIISVSLILFFAILLQTPVGGRFMASFDLGEISNSERLDNWGEAITLIKENPLVGVGIGSYSLNVGKLRGYNDVDYRLPLYAHNTYLDIWAEMGIIGLFLWISIFISIFYRGIIALFKNNNKQLYLIGLLSAMAWFFIQTLFDTPLYSPRVIPILMVILGLLGSCLRKKNNTTTST